MTPDQKEELTRFEQKVASVLNEMESLYRMANSPDAARQVLDSSFFLRSALNTEKGYYSWTPRIMKG